MLPRLPFDFLVVVGVEDAVRLAARSAATRPRNWRRVMKSVQMELSGGHGCVPSDFGWMRRCRRSPDPTRPVFVASAPGTRCVVVSLLWASGVKVCLVSGRGEMPGIPRSCRASLRADRVSKGPVTYRWLPMRWRRRRRGRPGGPRGGRRTPGRAGASGAEGIEAAVGDEAAVVQDEDPVGEGDRLVDVVVTSSTPGRYLLHSRAAGRACGG